jgi:hypothetical protein
VLLRAALLLWEWEAAVRLQAAIRAFLARKAIATLSFQRSR